MIQRVIHCIMVSVLTIYSIHTYALFERSSAALAACQQQWDSAHTKHLKLLAQNHTDPQLLHDTGVCAYKVQDYEHAIQYFNQVTASDNANDQLKHDAHYNCGNAHAMQSAFKQAAYEYEQALLYDPDDQAAKDNLSVVKQLQQQGDDSSDSDSDSGNDSGEQGDGEGDADNDSSDENSSGNDQQEEQQDNSAQDNDQENESESKQEPQDPSAPDDTENNDEGQENENTEDQQQEQSEQDTDTNTDPDQTPSEPDTNDAPLDGNSDKNDRNTPQEADNNSPNTKEQDNQQAPEDEPYREDEPYGQEGAPDQDSSKDSDASSGNQGQEEQDSYTDDENGFFGTNQDDDMPSWMAELLEQQDQDDAAMNRAFTIRQMQSGDEHEQKHCW